jgi:hypothetical protein
MLRRLLFQDFADSLLYLAGVLCAADSLEGCAGVPCDVELGFAPEELTGECRHADYAPLSHARECADFVAALFEDSGIACEHAGGNLSVFVLPPLCETAVHPAMQGNDFPYALDGCFALLGEKTFVFEGVVFFRYPRIFAPRPVASRSVSAVVADIEGLVAFRRLGLAGCSTFFCPGFCACPVRSLRQKLIGVGVDAGPFEILVNEAHRLRVLGVVVSFSCCGFGAVVEGSGRGDNDEGKNQARQRCPEGGVRCHNSADFEQ